MRTTMSKENHSIISLEIPNELKEKIRLEAFNNHITVSEYIRRVLVETINNEKDTGSTK